MKTKLFTLTKNNLDLVNIKRTSNIIIPKSFIYNDTEFILHTIGFEVFSGWKELKSIILPNTIKIIEPKAFMDCINLKTINIPQGLEKIEEKAKKYEKLQQKETKS